MSRLRAVLPDERDVADLLRRVQGMATQSSLTILGFTPQAVAKKTIYVEWPIGLKLEGTYHDLGRFLERVSKFPRIINVGDLKVKALDKIEQRRDDHGGAHRHHFRARSNSQPATQAPAGCSGCERRAKVGVATMPRTICTWCCGRGAERRRRDGGRRQPPVAPQTPPASARSCQRRLRLRRPQRRSSAGIRSKTGANAGGERRGRDRITSSRPAGLYLQAARVVGIRSSRC